VCWNGDGRRVYVNQEIALKLSKSLANRLCNIFLRNLTLISRSLLFVVLAKFLQPRDLGLYGLLSSTITYFLYLVGLDFYTFTTREIFLYNKDQWGALLKSQVVFLLIIYSISIPFILLIFVFKIVPWSLLVFFFIILVFEHLGQEIARLLIAISEQVYASVLIFLRSGLWPVVVFLLMYSSADARKLDVVLITWCCCSFVSVLIGFYRLRKVNMGGWDRRVDWGWLGKGVRIVMPFLVGTLCIRGVLTLDRYWLESLVGLEVLGAYVFFWGICNALSSFLDAGVFSFSYPKLIEYYSQGDFSKFKKEMLSLLYITLLFLMAFIILSIFFIEFFINFIEKPIFKNYLEIFSWLLLASFFYGLSMVPHYGLYAKRLDKAIIGANVLSFPVFVISTWVCLRYINPISAIPIGICMAFCFILVWKSISFCTARAKDLV
jgi:O-antigen/teichoic acid export membrane protein